MKKLGLFLSLLICSISLTGCFKVLDGDGMIDSQRQPSYEVLEWTGYDCFGGACEDFTYHEGKIVKYTNPEFGLRITTAKYINLTGCFTIFSESGNTIFVNYCGNDNSDTKEFITMYNKNPEQSLEEIIRAEHVNNGCIYTNYLGGYGYYQVDDPEKWISGSFDGVQYRIAHDKDVCDYWGKEFIKNDSSDDNDFAYEDLINNEMFEIFYVESEDKTRYYKIGAKTSLVGGETIFGKIEVF